MVSQNDPIRSFFNWVQIKEVLSPFELGIKKVVKDLESCCYEVSKNKANGDEVITQLAGSAKKRDWCIISWQRKKGLSNKVQIIGHGHRAAIYKEDGAVVNRFQFVVTLFLLANNVVKQFPGHFEAVKKRLQKAGDEEKLSLSTKPIISGELKLRESKNECFGPFQRRATYKEGKHVSFEYLICFVFEQLTQSLQKFDLDALRKGQNRFGTHLPMLSLSQFACLKAITGIWEGPKAAVNTIVGNLRFGGNWSKFVVTWFLLVNRVSQAFLGQLEIIKKQMQKMCYEGNSCLCTKSRVSGELGQGESKDKCFGPLQRCITGKEVTHILFGCCIGFVFSQLTQHLQKFDLDVLQKGHQSSCTSLSVSSSSQFARVGGASSMITGSSSVSQGGDDMVNAGNREDSGGASAQELASGMEHLSSSLSTISSSELAEILPQSGHSSKDYPDKRKLSSVKEFFRYTESEGRRFFEELDRDGDGQVTLEDLEIVFRKRKLPRNYAQEFMGSARSHIFSKSIGWKQFLSLMEQKEATILRAYTSLCLSDSGTLQKSEILASLRNVGLPANEDNAVAMMQFLNADTEGSISYGHFRNFMLLLPLDRLQHDSQSTWLEAATTVTTAPPIEIPAGSVLKSALAGGISCAFSTALMHPVDTIKTQVQASTLSLPQLIAKLPQIGVKGIYRGSIPAILGQFLSHGLRTGICEASKYVLITIAPTLPDMQVQSLASFCGTYLGTVSRIPCEVLKQRLQAGIFDNVGVALVGTWNQDGIKGFFSGTGATLLREVPFYVVGTRLYDETKKVVQKLIRRELEPWERMAIGAVTGGLTAVFTTPVDVVKTRMMVYSHGQSVSMLSVALSILHHEGPLGLYKGAVPRFFWVAPLGALNFAGYELLRKAMDRKKELVGDKLSQKKVAGSG